jgi:hypothetical protein
MDRWTESMGPVHRSMTPSLNVGHRINDLRPRSNVAKGYQMILSWLHVSIWTADILNSESFFLLLISAISDVMYDWGSSLALNGGYRWRMVAPWLKAHQKTWDHDPGHLTRLGLVKNNEKGMDFLTNKVLGLGKAPAMMCNGEALSSHFSDGGGRLQGMEWAGTSLNGCGAMSWSSMWGHRDPKFCRAVAQWAWASARVWHKFGEKSGSWWRYLKGGYC